MPKRRMIRFWMTALLWLAALIWPAGEALGEKAAAVAKDKELLPVKVHQLILDPASLQPVVFLADFQGERALPIWIGPCEANAISNELQGIKHPRPLTHDLLEKIIQKANGKIRRIVITHSKENTYYATIVMEKKGSLTEIDARPSDSIVLALKAKAPIFVSKTLFDRMAIPLAERKGVEERYGLTLQELTPLLAQSFSYSSTRGALISDVRQGSLAEKDGLQRGDIFVEVGGELVEDVRSIQEVLAKHQAPVPARIFRQGRLLSITLHTK